MLDGGRDAKHRVRQRAVEIKKYRFHANKLSLLSSYTQSIKKEAT